MIKLILLGKPLSTNNIYKYHSRFGHPSSYMTNEGRKLKESYINQIKSQFNGELLNGNISLLVKLFRERNVGDIDNFNKILFDSMSGTVFADDKQIVHLEIYKYTDKNNPRIEVEIKNHET